MTFTHIISVGYTASNGAWRLLLLALTVAYAHGLFAATALGPFRTEADALRAQSLLDGLSTIELRETFQVIDYIVVSDRTGPQLGRTLLAELRRSGISDVVYVRTGDFGGRVSAGVYVGTESPARRVRQLKDKGFSFETLPRLTREVGLAWITTNREVTPAELADIERMLAYSVDATQTASPEPEPAVVPEPTAPTALEPTVTAPVDPVEVPAEPDAKAEVTDGAPVTASPPLAAPDTPAATIVREEVQVLASPIPDQPPQPTVKPSSEAIPDSPGKQSLNPALVLGLLVAVGGVIAVIFMLASRQKARTNTAARAEELPPLQQAAAFATPVPAHSAAGDASETDETEASAGEPAPPANEAIHSASAALLESVDASDRRAIDLVADLVALAQSDQHSGDSFALDQVLLSEVNNARSIHAISTIRYRPTSPLPRVQGADEALRRLLGILIQQAVSFDDAAHILVTAHYIEAIDTEPGQLQLSVTNEAALLEDDELARVDDPSSGMGLRYDVAGQLAEKMGGHINLSSRFGLGTRIDLALALAAAESDGDTAGFTPSKRDQVVQQLAAEFGLASTAAQPLGETPLPGMQTSPADPVDLFVGQLETQLKEIETARAKGDLETLTRVAKWTARYAAGVGMTGLAERMTRFHRLMVQGQELAALAQLAALYLAITSIQRESQPIAQSEAG